MNNINTNSHSENLEKSSRWNKLPYTLLLVSLLSLNNPAEAKTADTYNFSQQDVEVLTDSGIVSNIERRTGTVLPRLYADKIKNFVKNSKVVEGSGAEFTEDFIVNQMKSNRGISKQNQLLFIWDAVYEQITKKNFYDGEDGDSNRLSEFENTIDSIENCGKKYRKEFMIYMEGKSAETKQNIMQKDTLGLREMAKFYSLYIKNPSNVKLEEIEKSKRLLQRVIPDCKKYGINYRAILLKEVGGDTKKVNEILKFYGIE